MIKSEQDAGSPAEAEAVLPLPTKSEVEVLQLLSEGNTLKEVARTRNRSRDTIKNQVTEIRDKLGARNIAHAVYIACKRGLIT